MEGDGRHSSEIRQVREPERLQLGIKLGISNSLVFDHDDSGRMENVGTKERIDLNPKFRRHVHRSCRIILALGSNEVGTKTRHVLYLFWRELGHVRTLLVRERLGSVRGRSIHSFPFSNNYILEPFEQWVVHRS